MVTTTRRRRSASRAADPGLTDRREALRREGRRRAARFGIVLLAAAGAYAGYTAYKNAQPEPTWVGASRSSGPTVEIGAPPAEYRVVSQVDAGNPVGTTVRTEILEVRRPWQSRLTTRNGAPPGRGVTDVLAGDFGKLDLQPTDGDESVLVVQPDLAASDVRLDVDLSALVEAGGVEVRERREVLGEPCQVYRTTAPPQGQTIGKLPSTSGDVVDSCIDRHGLILEQLQFFNDHLLLRRRVTEIDLHPRFGDHDLDVSKATTVPIQFGGGAIADVDPDQVQPGTMFFLDEPPSGFRFQGRYAVAPSQPGNSSGTGQGNRRSSFVDVWTDGADVVVLDQGGLTFGGDALGDSPLASRVDLGKLGAGQSVPGPRLSQVSITLPDDRYVRVLGTLPVERLVALMKTLRRVEG